MPTTAVHLRDSSYRGHRVPFSFADEIVFNITCVSTKKIDWYSSSLDTKPLGSHGHGCVIWLWWLQQYIWACALLDARALNRQHVANERTCGWWQTIKAYVLFLSNIRRLRSCIGVVIFYPGLIIAQQRPRLCPRGWLSGTQSFSNGKFGGVVIIIEQRVGKGKKRTNKPFFSPIGVTTRLVANTPAHADIMRCVGVTSIGTGAAAMSSERHWNGIHCRRSLERLRKDTRLLARVPSDSRVLNSRGEGT